VPRNAPVERALACGCNQRNGDRECRTLSLHTVHLDRAAQHTGGDVVYNVQAQTRTTLPQSRGEERFEQMMHMLRGDAPTAVTHGQGDAIRPDATRANGNIAGDLTLVVGMQKGVFDQMRQHLAQRSRKAVELRVLLDIGRE